MKNGSSILNAPNYIELTASSNTVSETSFADATLTKDDYIQWELVQGNAVAADVTIHVRFQWEL